MAKFMQILFIASLAFAVCSAEAARNSGFRGRRTRFLARQEVEDVTPYPTADELRPQVPFDEAIAAGEITPNQPADQPEPAAFQPDEIYGPPEFEEFVPVEEEAFPARLTARRLAFRKGAVHSAKLRKAAPVRLQLQRQFVPQTFFYYIPQ